jgi:hypothetical protein
MADLVHAAAIVDIQALGYHDLVLVRASMASLERAAARNCG